MTRLTKSGRSGIPGTTKLDDLKTCDLIIEAMAENVARRNIYALDEVVGDAISVEHVVLCTELASKTKRPDRSPGCTSSILCRS